MRRRGLKLDPPPEGWPVLSDIDEHGAALVVRYPREVGHRIGQWLSRSI
jgi:hypothetical protein